MKLLFILAIILGIYLGLSHPRQYEVQSIVMPTVTPTLTPTPNAKEVIDEITKVWKEEKTNDIVWAINCFYSESGLRYNALNVNRNSTVDSGPAQVNSVHIKRFGPRFQQDWRESLRVAYQIWKNRGVSAWYAKACN